MEIMPWLMRHARCFLLSAYGLLCFVTMAYAGGASGPGSVAGPLPCLDAELCVHLTPHHKAGKIEFYWENFWTSNMHYPVSVGVDFYVNGKVVLSDGKFIPHQGLLPFNHVQWILVPGKSYQVKVVWAMLLPKCRSLTYDDPAYYKPCLYYITSSNVMISVPDYYDPLAFYHKGDQVQDKEHTVYCALQDIEGSGKPFDRGLWSVCSLNIRQGPGKNLWHMS